MESQARSRNQADLPALTPIAFLKESDFPDELSSAASYNGFSSNGIERGPWGASDFLEADATPRFVKLLTCYSLLKMENGDPQKRCYARITTGDLERLLELAKLDRQQFFVKHPKWAEYYADRVLGTALCQGAARHYLRGDVGINDFDVYTFYAANPARRWYAKRLASVDFGDPRFGCSEKSRPGFVGRRVDLMGRALEVLPETDLGVALRTYLGLARTATARLLSQKAVVLLEPRIGEVVWPVGGRSSS